MTHDYFDPSSNGWTWRLSGHFRIASLVSAWALLMLAGTMGPLMMPLAVARLGLSGVQTLLNVRLGRAWPVAKQTRLDWALMAMMIAGAYVAVGIGHVSGNVHTPAAFIPMLLPFSVLQLRMAGRSYRAHANPRPAELLKAPGAQVRIPVLDRWPAAIREIGTRVIWRPPSAASRVP